MVIVSSDRQGGRRIIKVIGTGAKISVLTLRREGPIPGRDDHTQSIAPFFELSAPVGSGAYRATTLHWLHQSNRVSLGADACGLAGASR